MNQMIHNQTNQHHSNKDELEKLFKKHYGLLISQAISFNPSSGEELDDYIQVAAIGMMKAIKNYDEEKSKFSTYAIVCIRNAIKNYLRTKNKSNSEVLLDFDVKLPEKEDIEEYIPSNLGPVEGWVIDLKLQGYTIREMCEIVNLPIHRVRKKLHNAYEKIRKANEESIDGK